MKGYPSYNNSLYISNLLHNLEMGCYHMRCWDENAISEMISLVMILFIVTGAITSIMLWGVPYMEEQKIAVRWESSLLQLDVMGDIIEDVFSEGINSSKKMNFQTSEGEFRYDAQGGRFVIYYSTYTDFDKNKTGYEENRFKFNVSFTDEPYNFKFWIENICTAHNDEELEFTATRLDGSMPSSTVQHSIPTPLVIEFNNFEFRDAVRVDITCIVEGTEYIDYGRIWLFDVGSLIYHAVLRSESNRVIIENGGVISAHSDSGYMYNEPSYWSQTLLDDSVLITMRTIQMKEDENRRLNISGFGTFQTEFMITTNNSTAQQIRQPIAFPIRMKIYGDDAAVYAWNFYYTDQMGFEKISEGDETDDTRLEIEMKVVNEVVKDLYFSLNHAIYKVGMEVK